MATRQSVTSVVHEYNQVAFVWKVVKQGNATLHTNGSEFRALFTGVKRTVVFLGFLEFLG